MIENLRAILPYGTNGQGKISDALLLEDECEKHELPQRIWRLTLETDGNTYTADCIVQTDKWEPQKGDFVLFERQPQGVEDMYIHATLLLWPHIYPFPLYSMSQLSRDNLAAPEEVTVVDVHQIDTDECVIVYRKDDVRLVDSFTVKDPAVMDTLLLDPAGKIITATIAPGETQPECTAASVKEVPAASDVMGTADQSTAQ